MSNVPNAGSHNRRLLLQIDTVLINTQFQSVGYVNAWRDKALTKGPPIDELLAEVSRVMDRFAKNLKWIEDLQESEHWGGVSAEAKVSVAALDAPCEICAVLDPLQASVAKFMAAEKVSYESLIAACDGYLSEVKAPPSVWPE